MARRARPPARLPARCIACALGLLVVAPAGTAGDEPAAGRLAGRGDELGKTQGPPDAGRDRPAEAARAVRFEVAEGRISITAGGRPVAAYRHGDARIRRPYLESIHAPGGAAVTRPNPPVPGADREDHADMHPGAWLAFGSLNGGDFWRNAADVTFEGLDGAPSTAGETGSFTVRHAYKLDGRVIAVERCRYTFVARRDVSIIVIDAVLRPRGKDLVFGDQQEMGFGVRLATALAEERGGRLVDAAGATGAAAIWGRQSAACAASGTLAAPGAAPARVSVVVVPDPANFRPSRMHARDYGLIVANPFADRDFRQGDERRTRVPAAGHLRLRFALAVAEGAADVAASSAAVLDLFASLERPAVPGDEDDDEDGGGER